MSVHRNEVLSRVRFKGYEEGDEEGIVDCLIEGLGSWPPFQIDVPKLDYWRWKYTGDSKHSIHYAEVDGKIVSHVADWPRPVRVLGHVYRSAQGVDLCTVPGFRGMGLGNKLVSALKGVCDDQADICLAFPNETSHRQVAKSGFADLGPRLLQYQYIVDKDAFFQGPIGLAKRVAYGVILSTKPPLRDVGAVEDARVVHLGAFDDRVEPLFARASKEFDFVFSRDVEYLNWRYCDPRAGRYEISALEDGGALVGYMVSKMDEQGGHRFCNIVDLLLDPDHVGQVTALLGDAYAAARKGGAVTLLCCLPEGHPYSQHFLDAGFRAEPRMTGAEEAVMSYYTSVPEIEGALRDPGTRCHITLGDTDWV